MRERGTRRATAIAGAFCFATIAGLGSAAAQTTINLNGPGAARNLSGPAGARAGGSLDQGDVSGDGRRDLVVGAPGGTTGRVYVLLGGPEHATGTLEERAVSVVTGPASFGTATAVGNIVSLDGVFPRDIVVGAPDAQSGRGVLYVFRGIAAGRTTEAAARLTITGAPGDRLGSALATADLNNDGYREIIAGAPGTDRVYVIYGGASIASRDLAAGADTVIQGHPTNNSGIGRVLAAGPLTADSIYDVAIGEPDANMVYLIGGTNGARLPARIDLPFGQGLPPALPAGVTSAFAGVDPGDRAGSSLRVSNFDGRGGFDLVIGASGGDGRTNGAPDAGEAYVLWNEQIGTSRSLAQAGVIFYGGQANQRLGSYVASGDINRDTFNDLVFLMNYGTGGEARAYFGREREELGVASGASRVVDLAVSGQEDRIIINDGATPMTSVAVFEVTGEGARDVVLAVPDAGGGGGSVYLTLCPQMVPSAVTAAFNLKEGESGTFDVNVRNGSPITLPWRVVASTATPWLSVTPSGGESNNAVTQGFQVRVNGATLAAGTEYTSSVQITSLSRDLTMTLTLGVNVSVTASRYLQIESPAPGSTVSQPFTITGYAIDTAAPTGTGVDRVDLYAMPVSGGMRRFLGTATYGQSRPAVASAHGARFGNSGFTLSVNNAPAGIFKIVGEAHSTVSDTLWSRLGDAPTITIRGLPPSVDINRDGFVDLVWQNTASRAVVYWSMSGLDMVAGGAVGPGTLPAGRWEVRTVADMNRDGRSDVVLQELNTGELLVWLLNGTALQEARALTRLSDPAWKVAAAADLNADGHTDLVFQHMTLGYVAAWLMNGTTLTEAKLLSPSQVTDLSWQIIGAGDVSGDGRPDLIWQNTSSRVLTSWIMNGTTMTTGGPFTVAGPSDTNWQARGATDINGDGKVDLLWQHVTQGYVAAWVLDGRTFIEARLLNPGQVSTSWLLGGPR